MTDDTHGDIRDDEPPMEGQRGYKGPAVLARLFTSGRQRDADDGPGRIHRWRRWLAYKLLPGTNEYRVALARQHALQELEFAAERSPRPQRTERLQRTRDRLAERVPVRREWDYDRGREDGDSA